MTDVKVTLKGDLIIEDAGVLDDLIQIAVASGVEVLIAPVEAKTSGETVVKTPAKRTPRKPKPKPEQKAPTHEDVIPPVAEEPVVSEDKPVEVEPEVKVKGDTTGAATYNYDTLLEKFTSLIDKDYDSALTLLEEYGVKTFNDLDKGQYDVFGTKVDKLLGG